MATAQALSALRGRTRRFADAEGVSALARHPDASVDDAIGLGIAALYRLLNEANAEQRNVARATFSTTPGTSMYLLPSALVRILTVDVDERGYKRMLPQMELTERPRYSDPNAGYAGSPTGFILEGQNIEILPMPQAAYTVTLWYVPEGQVLAAATDEMLFDLRFDEYVCAYAARTLCMKDTRGDQVAMLSGNLSELEAHVRQWARSRSGTPSRIRDIRETGYQGRWRTWRR